MSSTQQPYEYTDGNPVNANDRARLSVVGCMSDLGGCNRPGRPPSKRGYTYGFCGELGVQLLWWGTLRTGCVVVPPIGGPAYINAQNVHTLGLPAYFGVLGFISNACTVQDLLGIFKGAVSRLYTTVTGVGFFSGSTPDGRVI